MLSFEMADIIKENSIDITVKRQAYSQDAGGIERPTVSNFGLRAMVTPVNFGSDDGKGRTYNSDNLNVSEGINIRSLKTAESLMLNDVVTFKGRDYQVYKIKDYELYSDFKSYVARLVI